MFLDKPRGVRRIRHHLILEVQLRCHHEERAHSRHDEQADGGGDQHLDQGEALPSTGILGAGPGESRVHFVLRSTQRYCVTGLLFTV